MIKDFKDLKSYQKAYENSLAIHKVSLSFPKFEQVELGGQMRRATKSIPLNIAEGFGRNANSTADFKRFIVMAKGSCDEVRVQLDYCKDLGYLTAEEYSHYEREYVEVSKMLLSMLRNWQ